jgi:hypothetical protein
VRDNPTVVAVWNPSIRAPDGTAATQVPHPSHRCTPYSQDFRSAVFIVVDNGGSRQESTIWSSSNFVRESFGQASIWQAGSVADSKTGGTFNDVYDKETIMLESFEDSMGFY